MFEKALVLAQDYTRPIIVSHRRESGALASQVATYIILNQEGWFLTANHVVSLLDDLAAEKEKYEKQRGPSHNRSARRRKGHGLVTEFSAWWGGDGIQVLDGKRDLEADLAVGRLDPYNPKSVSHYPTFKNPEVNFQPGVNLCKLGFPFNEIKPQFSNNGFQLANAVPTTLFPLEGMYIRTGDIHNQASGRHTLVVETSSPGLPGQSGGPTFDSKGRVWAMQSQTRHYSLAFGEQKPQLLNTGLGVHAKTILEFLEQCGIRVSVSKD